MNAFVEYTCTQEIKKGRNVTKEGYISTTSERFAHWLNKRGRNLQWNDDIERARELCRNREVEISQVKLFTPKLGWDNYLTQKFGETEEGKTIEGKLDIWNEIRLPTPLLYVASFGKLEDVFVFDGAGFVSDPNTTYKGKRVEVGIMLHNFKHLTF